MLPENIVEEFVRPTPLRRQIVSLAWPSLSTSERLQILARSDVQRWLVELALQDEEPIVRYWGACEYRGPSRTTITDGKFVHLSPDEVPVDELGRKAANDPCEFVRLAVDDTPYAQASPLSRLVRLRGKRSVFLSFFIGWLSSSIDGGIPDGDLAECAEEFFSKPNTMRTLATTERPDWVDGLDDYLYLKELEDFWRLMGKAGPQLGATVVSRLPFRYHGHNISGDRIMSLPHDTLTEIIKLFPEQDVVAKVRDQILANPENFPDEFVAKVREVTSLREENPGSLGLGPVAPPKDLKEEIVELRGELAKLRAEVLEASANSQRRRWF